LPDIIAYDETQNNAIHSEYIIFKRLRARTLTHILKDVFNSQQLSFEEKFTRITHFAK